jgi:hypothetical protein
MWMGWRLWFGSHPARVARLAGLALVTLVMALAAGFLLLPFAVRWLVRAVVLALNACVWLAASLGAGVDVWTLTMSVARSIRERLLTTEAGAAAAVMMLVSAAALYGLQRLLGSDEESS